MSHTLAGPQLHRGRGPWTVSRVDAMNRTLPRCPGDRDALLVYELGTHVEELGHERR